MRPGQPAGVRSRQLGLAMAVLQSALDAAVRLDSGLRDAIVSGCGVPDDAVRSLRIFRGSADQVRAVRELARTVLAGHPALDDAVLVASELAANSVRHSASGRAGGLFVVHVTTVSATHAAVIVTDQPGGRIPDAHAAGPGAESGRGLAVVTALSWLVLTAGGCGMRSVLAVVPAGTPGRDGTQAEVSPVTRAPACRTRTR